MAVLTRPAAPESASMGTPTGRISGLNDTPDRSAPVAQQVLDPTTPKGVYPQDILDRFRHWYPLRTRVRTSRAQPGAQQPVQVWAPDPLRVGAIISAEGAPGDILMSEGAQATLGFPIPGGGVFTYGPEVPQALWLFSPAGPATVFIMELIKVDASLSS